jgi:hypothetical protein
VLKSASHDCDLSIRDENDSADRLPLESGKPCCGTQTRSLEPRLDRDAQVRIGRDLRGTYVARRLKPRPARVLDLVACVTLSARRTLQ